MVRINIPIPTLRGTSGAWIIDVIAKARLKPMNTLDMDWIHELFGSMNFLTRLIKRKMKEATR